MIVRAGQLGFAGARDEDRQHWLGAFRRFLDALDSPVQVLVRSRPGSGDESPSPGPTTPDRDDRRAADLAFADALAQRRDAVHREVLFPVSSSTQDRVNDLLRDLALSAETELPPADRYGEERRDAFLDAGGWHRTWFLDRFPGTELEPSWLNHLIPPDLRIDLAWHAIPVPTAWMIQHLQRRLAAYRATRLAAAATDVMIEGALPAAEQLQRRLAASEERAFRVSIYLTVTTTSAEELDAAATRIEQNARSLLVALQPTTFEMAAGRLATLPLADDRLARHHVLDTSALVTLFPWRDSELRHRQGLALGTSRATGRPVVLDPFDQRLYANANIGVFGHSGAGKTFLLSCIALGAYASGAQVFVLDPEHEYGRLAKAVGGQDIQLALGSGHSLNVLPSIQTAAGQAEAILGPAVADAVDLVAIITGGLDEAERAGVDRAVRDAYAQTPAPVLRDVAAHLGPGRARTVLGRWVDGSLGAMFSRPTNVDLDADFVVFGMRELRDELVAPVHFLLAEALWSRVKGRGRRRLLLIDELGLLFEDPTLRRFVVALARRIRKYDGALVFATQNPGDLLASEAGAVVATNPAIHFFGAARPGEAARLQQAFQLSPAQKAMVETARRGEFLLSAAAERIPLRVMASTWQAEVIDFSRSAPMARAPPWRS